MCGLRGYLVAVAEPGWMASWPAVRVLGTVRLVRVSLVASHFREVSAEVASLTTPGDASRRGSVPIAAKGQFRVPSTDALLGDEPTSARGAQLSRYRRNRRQSRRESHWPSYGRNTPAETVVLRTLPGHRNDHVHRHRDALQEVQAGKTVLSVGERRRQRQGKRA
jgi:hypothetical protein